MVKWLKDAVFYEIYPQSFYDTNGDGVGDFQGIIDKLDYVKSLGCNAIWMNPCFDSPFADAGYDVRDYKKTAARYGTNEDLYRLFDEVHKREMHILLDLVAGHTSEQHEWFQKSRLDDKNEYAHRFIWTDGWFDMPDNLKGVAGMAPRDAMYVVNFFQTQPALNYGFLHPNKPWQRSMDDPECIATKEALWDVMDFWMNKGCDGFRVDMADSLVKNDDEKKSGTCAIWTYLRRKMEEKYPEAVLVSEWNNPNMSLNAGFHMDFNLNWDGNGYNLLTRDSINSSPIFAQNSSRSICEFLADYLPKYESTKYSGKYCLITGNHDTPRISYSLDVDELKMVYAFMFMMPGAPFIYYGDEIGMRYIKDLPSKEGGYTRTGTRTPMQWTEGANKGFSNASADKLYLPIDDSDGAPTVETQSGQEGSLLEFVRSMLKLRHETEDLKNDTNLHFVYSKSYARAFAFTRGDLLIVFNPDQATQKIDTQDMILTEKFSADEFEKMYEYGEVNADENVVTLAKQSFAVFRKIEK